MRPIEYRAWYQKEQKMCEVLSLSWWNEEPHGKTPLAYIELRHSDNCYHVHIEEVELMQYTGLLDKNGKKIFEGDVLQFKKHGYVYNDQEIAIALVEFDDGGFSPFCVPLGSNDCAESAYNTCKPKECEIIGNAWEHPSLSGSKEREQSDEAN